MAWPTSLQVALKEWAVVCSALQSGRQIVLLRKGGIYESGGEFEVENRQFLLFPTYLHQNPRMLKPAAQEGLETPAAEPDLVRLAIAGVVSDVIAVKDRRQMDALDAEHIWAPPLIDMRFSYKPENPLYLLLVRAYALHEPTAVQNTPAYAGCKSWVPLDQPIATGDAWPVLDDVKYQFKRQAILDAVGSGV